MASFVFYLSPYKMENGKQTIILRVTIDRQKKEKQTAFEVVAKDWDAKKERVKPHHINAKAINDALEAIYNNAEATYAAFVTAKIQPTAKDIITRIFVSDDFYKIAYAHIEALDKAKKFGTRDRKRSVVKKLKEYAPVLSIQQITADFVKDYKEYLKGKGNSHNTIIQNLATIRSIAKASGIALNGTPFSGNVGTYRKDKTKPLTLEDVQKLREYEPAGKWEEIAKDSFLFSFYAAGMRSSDVLQLKWSDIDGDYITYYESKKQYQDAPGLDVPMNKHLKEILKRRSRQGATIFNVITETDPEKRYRQIGNAQAEIDKALKRAAFNAGIHKPIKFKLARTTFANIAKQKTGNDVYGIKEAMGHTKIATTEIYLGSDQKTVDDLLKVVYGSVN